MCWSVINTKNTNFAEVGGWVGGWVVKNIQHVCGVLLGRPHRGAPSSLHQFENQRVTQYDGESASTTDYKPWSEPIKVHKLENEDTISKGVFFWDHYKQVSHSKYRLNLKTITNNMLKMIL